MGDENNFSMYKMELDGTAVSDATAGPASGVTPISNASFEGVTYAPPLPGISDDHYIYLVDENSNSVVPVNYNTNKYSKPIPLSGMAGYSSILCTGSTLQTVQQAFNQAGNSGLEGITWNSDLSRFYLLKEKSPGLLIQVSADLKTIQACQTLTYNNADYADVSYDSTRHKYWIVSDEGKSVALYDWKPRRAWCSNGTLATTTARVWPSTRPRANSPSCPTTAAVRRRTSTFTRFSETGDAGAVSPVGPPRCLRGPLSGLTGDGDRQETGTVQVSSPVSGRR